MKLGQVTDIVMEKYLRSVLHLLESWVQISGIFYFTNLLIKKYLG